jgi:nucleotide-binding universal stress UspA family protein
MSIKTILVPFGSVDEDADLLNAAFQLGQRFSGHVVGMFLNEQRRLLTAQNMMMSRELLPRGSHDITATLSQWESGLDPLLERARELFNRVADAYQAAIIEAPPSAHVSASFRSLDGADDDELAVEGRLHDVVVMRRPGRDAPKSENRRPRAVLFGSGRPVILVPRGQVASIGTRVLIAWDGSARSARAASSARQYFGNANQVGILSVVREHPMALPTEGFRKYLQWHGVDAELIERPLGNRLVGEVILNEAQRFGCDLLVMGAYEQASFRRSLTGGLTNFIVSKAGLPVFMSH